MTDVVLYPSCVIGHRGAAALAPENTLASIRRAARDGARMVEVDVKLTADARPVILHDDRVDRTTDGEGAMIDLPFEAVRALDAGAWFSPEFRGEPLPTFEEFLETLIELDLQTNIEIKPCPGRDEETARVSLAVGREVWPENRPLPVISSFSRPCLAVARDMAHSGEGPDWPRALLADTLPEDWDAVAKDLDLRAAHLGADGLTEEQVRAVKAGGYALAIWTINDPEQAKRLLGWGADAIITDDPGKMIAALL